jgi:polar amino acid transport system substrate-binding protein
MRIITFIALLVISLNSMANCTVKLRVFDLLPNYYQDKNGQWRGSSVDQSVAIIKKAGCSVEYVFTPWKRALYLMSLGKLDMMSNLSMTDSRQQFIDFFAAQHTEKVVLVVKRGSNIQIQSLEDFTQLAKPIGILDGAFYGQQLADKIKDDKEFSAKLVIFNKFDLMLDALTNNRISGFIQDKQSMQRLLGKGRNNQFFEIHPYVLYQNTVYFGLSKKSVNSQLRDKLTQAYKELKAAGELTKILGKYPAN